MRTSRSAVGLFLMLMVALVGCDSGSTGPGGNLTGTWEGPFSFFPTGSPTTIRFTLNQAGSTVTGSWTNYYPNGSVDETGTISGAVSNNAFAGIMRLSRATCATAEAAINGTVGGSTMTWSTGGFVGGSCTTPGFSINLTKK